MKLLTLALLAILPAAAFAQADAPKPPATPEQVYAQSLVDQRNSLLVQAADEAAQIAALKQALGLAQKEVAALTAKVEALTPKAKTPATPKAPATAAK